MEPTREMSIRCPHCGEDIVNEHLLAGETIHNVERNLETRGVTVYLKTKCLNPSCGGPIYITLWIVRISKEPPEIMKETSSHARL